MNNVLLEIRNLSKVYESKGVSVQALSDINLTVYQGETIGIVGESGCGKTTLGRCVVRGIDATDGQVLFHTDEDGVIDFLKATRAQMKKYRRDIQMIFQDPYASLDPRMSVGQIVAEPLSAHRIGDRKQRQALVRELMEQVGIRPELSIRYPHQFSGGQRQRIGIARALALNPELIICDEPVSALDVSIQAQILNLLGDLQQQRRLTYLFISHDLNVVRYLSDRVIVMFLGQMCELADTEALYAAPRHPYTRFLLESVPQPDPTLRDADRAILTGEVSSPVNPPAGCRFHPRCPYADDRCRREHPALAELAPGHFCACHHPLEG